MRDDGSIYFDGGQTQNQGGQPLTDVCTGTQFNLDVQVIHYSDGNVPPPPPPPTDCDVIVPDTFYE